MERAAPRETSPVSERRDISLEPGRALRRAMAARHALIDPQHESAFRLFSGFYEGDPTLVMDVYATTLVVEARGQSSALDEALAAARDALPWLTCGLVKVRNSRDLAERNGRIVFGGEPSRRIREDGVRYALDLTLNQDASFYLDTRLLRTWARAKLGGKSALNTFAYTGSLGVAAMAGGASRVVHIDLNRSFLNLAKATYSLNGFPVARADFLTADFWPALARLNRAGERFDCVFLDPPFFAQTRGGVVDTERNIARLINKCRPLINDGGWLVVCDNALFVSGAAFMATLEALCADGYLSVEERINVPPDITGYPETVIGAPPVDPAPFNHPTKIAVLRVRRKSSPSRSSAAEPQ